VGHWESVSRSKLPDDLYDFFSNQRADAQQ